MERYKILVLNTLLAYSHAWSMILAVTTKDYRLHESIGAKRGHGMDLNFTSSCTNSWKRLHSPAHKICDGFKVFMPPSPKSRISMAFFVERSFLNYFFCRAGCRSNERTLICWCETNCTLLTAYLSAFALKVVDLSSSVEFVSRLLPCYCGF